MGEIADIASSIKEFGKSVSDVIRNTGSSVSKVVQPSARSISSMSLQGTANFAVIISDSVDFDDALMIGKSLEQRFATFLLTVLTMNPYMAVNKHENPSADKYLKQFHQNMGTQYEIHSSGSIPILDSMDVSAITEDMSDFITKADNIGIDYDCCITEAFRIASTIYNDVTSKVIDAQNKKFNYIIDEVTEQSILNNVGKVEVASFMEAYAGKHKPKGVTWSDKKQTNPFPNNDFKKSNDSVPTLLHIRVFPYDVDNNTKSLEPLDFIVGVKATIHQVSSSDVISNLASGLQNGSTFFNFIKWTTGETKFFKDFLLMIDQNKTDAVNSSSSNGNWWSALRRRKASSTIRKFIKGKTILPNATIVCTTDDLIALKETHGFDLTGSNTDMVYTIMRKYFLISFVRVNPALQRVDFLFDGNSQFETSSYSTISKEIGKDDKKFKEMMKLLGRSA